MHANDLQAWIDGTPPPYALTGLGATPHLSAGMAAQMRSICLFGLNDYMGLSVHPEVCAAASAAALQVRQGPLGLPTFHGWGRRHGWLQLPLQALIFIRCQVL